MNEQDEPSNTHQDIGYLSYEEFIALRGNFSAPVENSQSSKPTRRWLRSTSGPQLGEETLGVEPRQELDENQRDINRRGAERLHPDIDLILERYLWNKARGDKIVAAAMLRAHLERSRRNQ